MHFTKLAFIFLLFVSTISAQNEPIKQKVDTVYYRSENGFIVPCRKDTAEGFMLKKEFNPNLYLCKIVYLQSENVMAEYEAYDKKYMSTDNNVSAIFPVKNGTYQDWYISGERKVSASYLNDKLNGDFKIFYKNGNVKRSEKWNNGEWVSGECFDENGNKTEYCSYMEMAVFIGGLPGLYKYMGETIKYPPAAQAAGVEGTVYIGFVINKEGTVTDLKVVRGVNRDLDAEALRMIRAMPKWKPARFEGNLVSMRFTLPVRFKLK